MGIAKRGKERRDAVAEAGLALCVAVGVLEECGDHPGTYYEGRLSLEDGYRAVHGLSVQHLAQGFATKKEMTDAMKAAAESFPSEECVECLRWKDE
jgi:hypothetical protein